MSDWIEIIIPATVASADDVAAMLAREVDAARAGTEIRGGDVVFWTGIEDSEAVLAQARTAAQRMATAGMAVDAQGVRARPALAETEWRDAWKRYFHVTRITRQVTIVPSWESHSPGPDEIVIHLDPGQAFGTGAHASTRLLLDELQRLRDQGARVERFLDVGTGSGILAIVTAKLWPASSGLAVDIDPLATQAAAENAAHNQVSDRIGSASTPVAEIADSFDLVLANIQADVLLGLVQAIAGRVRPGGRLLLAGLLAAQAHPVATAYVERAGLVIEALRPSEHDPEWASAILCRPPAPR